MAGHDWALLGMGGHGCTDLLAGPGKSWQALTYKSYQP